MKIRVLICLVVASVSLVGCSGGSDSSSDSKSDSSSDTTAGVKNAAENCKAEPAPDVDYHDCDLEGAYGDKLTGADLSGANLSGANLELADLTGTNLTGADLSNAKLKFTTLDKTNLTDANLTGVIFGGQEGPVFAETAIWSNTTCTDGTVQSVQCPTTGN